MAQLEVADFIKPVFLTERAFSIANAAWPKISTYIEQQGGVRRYLTKLNAVNDPSFSDPTLKKFLFSYFSQLLNPAGFFLKEFNLAYEIKNLNSYGATNSLLIVQSRGTAKIPFIIFDICVSNVLDISEDQFEEVFFHELTHIEQATNLLLELTVDNILETVPENRPLFIDRLEQYFTDRNLDPKVNDGEISSYARELALKIFTRHKIELKNMPLEDRKKFLSHNIIPYYETYMSPGVKENIFDNLSNASRGVFLRSFVSQLYDFCDGLL